MKTQSRQLIFLFVALIILLIGCVSIIVNFSKEKDDKNNHYTDIKTTQEEKIEGKYKPSIINEQYRRLDNDEIKLLDEVIDYIIKNINEKNYSALYDMVPDWHKTIKFTSLDSFREYIDENYNESEYQCISYFMTVSTCYLKISDSNQKTTELKIKLFETLEQTQILFENIVGIIEADTRINFSKLTMDLKAFAEYDRDLSAVFNIKNKTDKDVNVKIENLKLIYIVRGISEEIVSKESYDFSIKANETKLVELLFNTNDSIVFSTDFIEFDITIDGETRHVEKAMLYPDEDL